MLACFALLAEAADGFAQAHGQSGDGFQALLAAVREPAVILAADFREQELGVAQDSGERVVHLMAEHFAKPLSLEVILHGSELLLLSGHFLRLAQAPLGDLQRNSAATARGPGRRVAP